jgi:hypothetical protein
MIPVSFNFARLELLIRDVNEELTLLVVSWKVAILIFDEEFYLLVFSSRTVFISTS